MDRLLPRVRPSEVGLNAEAILKFAEEAGKKYGIHGFEIVRHGKVAANGWWYPYQETDTHVLFSLSKTFTATAVGIAQGEGLLSVEDYVLDYFKGRLPADPCENMKKMKIRHLLNMAAGHSVEPSVFGPDHSWIEAFLTSYVDREPGSWWCYNTPATYMLAAIVQHVSGKTVSDYLKPRLFDPLGIEEYWWETSPEGIETGGFGLNVRLETVAKLGLLYLNDGIWEGKRLLPEGWVSELSENRLPTLTAHHYQAQQGYGYQVWMCDREGAYRGDGAFGQFMVVLPKEDMVIAINSGEELHLDVMQLAFDTILPSIDSVSDSETEEKLVQFTSSMVLKLPLGTEFSDTMLGVNCKTYALSPNRFDLEEIRFDFENSSMMMKIHGVESVIKLGYGHWLCSETSAPLHGSSSRDFLFHDAAGSYAWKDQQLIVSIAYYKTPFVDTFIFDFEESGMILHFKRNAAFWKCEEEIWGRPVGVLRERYAWKAALKEGMLSEYRRRHEQIWPEMKQLLKKAGIRNYTIWNTGNELFGYYECEKGIDFAARMQAESAVVDRWNEFMDDVMTMDMDPETGAQPLLTQVFLLK